MRFEKIQLWLALPISIVSLIVAIFSAHYASKAADVAEQARMDSRALGGLDIEPRLLLITELYGGKRTPPHLRIRNFGPADAIHLEVRLVEYRYDAKQSKVRVGMTGDDQEFHVGTLTPGSEWFSEIPADFAQRGFLTLMLWEPNHTNIIGIRLDYRRPADRKPYRKEAFYFLNPHGRWVSENDNSLPPEIYDPVRDAVRHSLGMFPSERFDWGDLLHDVPPTPPK